MRQPIPFGKYLLLDRVSVGGMAEVFKAKSYGVEGFEKVIAIKRILPSMGEDRDFIKMFIDEAKIAGQLSHANICQIFELGRIEGAHFIAMEYIWGKDLLQIQNRFKKFGQIMPIHMACYVVSKVCEGLDYAHRKKDALGRPLQIVHRDCSPQNVLISYEGEVKLIDFGIAKAASRSSRTMAGVLKGKFGYMSPEQVRGLPLDRRSDLFALGTILYESLTGERLFLGESDFSTLERVRNADVQSPTLRNRNIPPEVERVVMRALTRDPDERYQWCSELRADLQAYMMSRPEVFTAKSMAQWMKQAFGAELNHERRQMEQYKSAGRDGLIQGKPQAEAKLDVEHYLGEAGEADDPTVLGGPSFDDVIDDAAPMATARPGGKQVTGGDFGDEAPTELFGEIGSLGDPDADENRPTYDRIDPVAELAAGASGVEVADLSNEAGLIGVHGAAQAEEAARAAQLATAQAPTISPSQGMQAPDLSQMGFAAPPQMPSFTPPGMGAAPHAAALDSGKFVATGSNDPSLFGSTANVTPLPRVSDLDRLRAQQKGGRKRRSSIAKDVGIGVGIAVVVLGLFAVGKYAFFGDTPGTREAQAAETGTIAITVPGNEKQQAEVWIGEERVGVVKGGEPLQTEPRPVGNYTVKVTRAGASDCSKDVEVSDGKVTIVQCTFVTQPETGLLVLEGLTAAHTVEIDGQEISAEAAAEPIQLSPGEEHTVVVKKGSLVIKELRPTTIAGQELRRVLVEATAPPIDPPEPEPASGSAPAGTSGTAVAVAKTVRASAADDERSTPRRRDTDTNKTGKRRTPKPDLTRKPSSTTSANASADKYGYLIANTTPWAQVWIDGRNTGRSTPIAKRSKIKLKPGKHRVMFVFGKQKFKYSVTIRAGETSKLVKDLPVKE